MEIPLKAQVECKDGLCGRCEYVLIDPLSDQVTSLVVRETASPNTEYIVPVEMVSATIADTIQLRCSKAKLRRMRRFVKTTFVEAKVPMMSPGYGGDEFIIVLPDTSGGVTFGRAELIGDYAKQFHLQYEGQILEALTLSIGVAVFPEHGTTCKAILKAVDTALYRAKHAGSGRVVMAN